MWDCLREYFRCAAESKNVFLLVDGLDEFEGTDEEHGDLLDLLVTFAAHKKVKICLSSRPWNIFHDKFGNYPQLKVEDLTYNDICAYVRDQLYSNERFRRLMQYDAAAAENLVTSLTSKAAGVFLWVRLVVRQLLKGLRDGDGIRLLSKTVEEIPADLDEYFIRLIESIEPQNRKEALELFQLALHDDNVLFSYRSNSLLDFSFIEEGKPDFALELDYHFLGLDFADACALDFRLESIMRKLTSRCMGLLEYNIGRSPVFELTELQEESDGGGDDEGSSMAESGQLKAIQNSGPTEATKLMQEMAVFTTKASLTVDFLHRSLCNFLQTSKVQNLLHQYTHGRPYDTMIFFRNARLVQLVALSE